MDFKTVLLITIEYERCVDIIVVRFGSQIYSFFLIPKISCVFHEDLNTEKFNVNLLCYLIIFE